MAVRNKGNPMVRISKQKQRRAQSPRKHRTPMPKTGSKPDQLPLGYKKHTNAVEGEMAKQFFIPKIR